MSPTSHTPRWPLVALALAGCVDLDSMVHNGIPCTETNADTCAGDPWDRACLSCDEPYDWARSYDWPAGALPESGSIRTPEIVESIPLSHDGAQLDAYWLPSHGENEENADATILYNHGNYLGIEHYMPRVLQLHEAGFNVLVWDYRGYGKTTPHQYPTAAEFFSDAQAIVKRTRELAPDLSRIAYYGYSLGALPAVEQALETPPCALVLEAPFTSIQALTENGAGLALPGGILTTGAYENIEKVPDYTGPLLVFAGTKDDLFRPEAVRELFNAAGSKDKRLITIVGAQHGVSDGITAVDYPTWAEALSERLTEGPCAATE